MNVFPSDKSKTMEPRFAEFTSWCWDTLVWEWKWSWVPQVKGQGHRAWNCPSACCAYITLLCFIDIH